jgi:hypothetical protein
MLKLKADSILKILFIGWILAGFSASAFAQARQNFNSCNAATNPGPQSMNLAEAMKIPAHDIDASLPVQCVADWLMSTLGTNSFSWSLADCQKPVAGNAPDNDAPKCFIAEGNTLNIAKLRVIIQVGTATNLISGRPTFHSASISGCGRSRNVAALSDLKDTIQSINAACAKQ